MRVRPGVYLDQLAGGQPVFLFTDTLTGTARDEISGLLPAGTSFRAQAASRTENELLE